MDWKALGLDELVGSAPACADDAGVAAVNRVLEGINRVAVEPLPLAWEIARRLRERAPSLRGWCFARVRTGRCRRSGVVTASSVCRTGSWPQSGIRPTTGRVARIIWIRSRGVGRSARRLAYYAEVGGDRIDPESVQFYRLFFRFEMTLVAASCALPVVNRTNLDARLAQISARLHRNLAELLFALEE